LSSRFFGRFDIFDVFNSFNAAQLRQIQLVISAPLKFHDLRLRRFGLVLALSPSECRQAMLVASGAHSCPADFAESVHPLAGLRREILILYLVDEHCYQP
jgi:hypothetical protein